MVVSSIYGSFEEGSLTALGTFRIGLGIYKAILEGLKNSEDSSVVLHIMYVLWEL